MRFLLALLLLLVACGEPCGEPCDRLVRQPYHLALINRDPESFFCFTQAPLIDFTTDETLAASFAEGCEVVVDRLCGETYLLVGCSAAEVALTCHFTEQMGTCTNDLTALVCHYDAWLDPAT